MPWPKLKVHFNTTFGSCPRTVYKEDPETGALIEETQDCNVKLPDAENFTIENQIKAGVNLKEVNTKVIRNGNNEKEIENLITKNTKNNKE